MSARGRPRKYGSASGTYPKDRTYYAEKNGYHFLPTWCLPGILPAMRTITAYVVFGACEQ